MLIIIEGLALSFLLLLICVIGIADGPEGSVYFYEQDVQERVVELGLITKERIKKRFLIAGISFMIPLLFLVPVAVYFVNGARGFLDTFIQILLILVIVGLFDRIFIDWYWVGKTKAWIIPGTEDMMPYIYGKTLVGKWVSTLIGFPVLAVLIAWVVSKL